jgi:hypothetical protein
MCSASLGIAVGKPVIGVLLGAGASADAGIPTTKEMTETLVERADVAEHRRLLQFISHTLAAHAASRGKTDAIVDVERLFAAVELLIERHEQAWSPFVGTWTSGLESFSAAEGSAFFSEHALARELRALDAEGGRYERLTGSPSESAARAIIREIQAARPKDVSDVLKRVRLEMLASLYDILRIEDPARVDYLGPLLDLYRTQGFLTIATLNYDRSLEEMAQRQNVGSDTGIGTWLAGSYPASVKNALLLLKLHGSIDWTVRSEWNAAELPLRKVVRLDPAVENREPAVVFGEGGKLRSEGPYLELLLAWSRQLQAVDGLLIVGYSFRDEHVNEIIARWFNAAPTRKVVLVDPASPNDRGRPDFLFRLASFAEPNLNASQPYIRFQHFPGTAGECLAAAVEASLTPLEEAA